MNDFSATASIIHPGAKSEQRPSLGYTCTIHVSGLHNGVVFDQRYVTYILGQYQSSRLPQGVDRAARYLSLDAVARVCLRGQCSLTPEDYDYFKIPRDSFIEYFVHMSAFEHVSRTGWRMLHLRDIDGPVASA